jgi:hypothetical protein
MQTSIRRVACLLALALCAMPTFAAVTTPPADTLKVDYFANANTTGAPDGTLRLTNPGTAPGNICASIFVFDPNQELTECCGCLLSPDGLRTLSVNIDIAGNPLTGVHLTTGLIEIVSTVPLAGACPMPTSISPEPALRAWTTHVQNGSFAETETASQDAPLSSAEVRRLTAECTGIRIGSGGGLCSCGGGD